MIITNATAYFTTFLRLFGFYETSIVKDVALTPLCRDIESAVVKGNPEAFNCLVTPGSGSSKEDTGGGIQYSLDDFSIFMWFCDCHKLEKLSLRRPCDKGGLLYIKFRRSREARGPQNPGEPESWAILGSYRTRKAFIKFVSKPREIFNKIRIYKMGSEGQRRMMSTPWRKKRDRLGRPAETVVLDKEVATSTVERVTQFFNSRSDYLKLGIPFQLGFLFFGPPGTGKTSWAEALASKFNIPIYIFSLGDDSLVDSDIDFLCDGMEPNSIALLEDLDQVNLGKRGTSVSSVLNLLDGIGARTDGRLLIATANDLTKLPSALLRPGRIDEKYQFRLASSTQVKEIFQNHMHLKNDNSKSNIDKLAEEFVEKIPERKISPSAISYYVRKQKTPQAAIANIEDFIQAQTQVSYLEIFF